MKRSAHHNARILSLDVFRGLTIVIMILVNSQNDEAYSFLTHSPWIGVTLADWVFPSFLFIVGLTTAISLNKQLQSETLKTNPIYFSILKRTILLVGLGLILNLLPNHFNLSHFRYYGILQRIALCYFCCALIYLNTTIKAQIILFCGLLLGYWLLMIYVPVPGFGANQLTTQGSWQSYVDQMLFASTHLYARTYDPEGLLSTLPAIATTLIGLMTAPILLSSAPKSRILKWLMVLGVSFLMMGWFWSFQFPMIKDLWTSSFVLWTGGWSLLIFALCYWAIDVLHFSCWAWPFKVFGVNALFAFILHVLLLKLQYYYQVQSGNETDNLKDTITQFLFHGLNATDASLMYALLFIVLNFTVVGLLYRYKIFIKI